MFAFLILLLPAVRRSSKLFSCLPKITHVTNLETLARCYHRGGGKGERESNTREGGRVHNHKINLKNMQQVNAQKHNHDLTLGM